MKWRNNVDPIIKNHLEVQIKEAAKNKSAIVASNEPKIAQLWIAIANLSKQNFDLSLRVKYMERALREALKQKPLEVPKPPAKKKTKQKKSK